MHGWINWTGGWMCLLSYCFINICSTVIQKFYINVLISTKEDTALSIRYYLFLYSSDNNWYYNFLWQLRIYSVPRINVLGIDWIFLYLLGIEWIFLYFFQSHAADRRKPHLFQNCLNLKCFKWKPTTYSLTHSLTRVSIPLLIHPLLTVTMYTEYSLQAFF